MRSRSSGKKLVLLGTYIAFFVVVASVIRPREVPRFVALMVSLGVIVAIATVVEYRLHVNVFYEVWKRSSPVTIPEGLDGRDSIGRLNVYGPTNEPLELAAMLAMVLPFAIIGSIDAATGADEFSTRSRLDSSSRAASRPPGRPALWRPSAPSSC